MSNHVLVIGGNGGIGSAIVTELMQSNLTGSGDSVSYPPQSELDVTWAVDEIQDAINKYTMSLDWPVAKGFTHLVYCAGINELAMIPNIDYKHRGNFSEILNVNVVGFARVLAAMIENNPLRSVVAISSDAAYRPMRGSLMYCAAKAALDMAVRCAARELAPDIRVNAVSPGMTEPTGMQEYIDKTVPAFRGWTSEEALRYEISQNPMGRRATTEEVAKLVTSVLFGPEYLTGAIIPINGGR